MTQRVDRRHDFEKKDTPELARYLRVLLEEYPATEYPGIHLDLAECLLQLRKNQHGRSSDA